MTTPANQPPEKPTNPESPSSIMRFGELKKLITDTIESVTGGGQPPAPRQPSSLRGQPAQPQRRSMDDEVSAALAKIEKDKERQAKEAQRDKDIDELKERTKERPPVERGRLHRFMGWGD